VIRIFSIEEISEDFISSREFLPKLFDMPFREEMK